VAYLHPDIACRVLPLETVQLDSVEPGEFAVLLRCVNGDMYSSLGQFAEGVYSGLDGLEVTGVTEFRVSSQRSGVERGDEDSLRLGGRVGYDTVRTLDEPRPEAALQDGFASGGGVQRRDVLHSEVDAPGLAVSLDEDCEQFALVSPDEFLDLSAYRRGEEDVRVLLVSDDRRTTEHRIPLLDQKPWKKTLEVGRADRHNARSNRLGDTKFRFTLNRDVQTLFQNDGL